MRGSPATRPGLRTDSYSTSPYGLYDSCVARILASGQPSGVLGTNYNIRTCIKNFGALVYGEMML